MTDNKAFLTDIDGGGVGDSTSRRKMEANSKLSGVRKEHEKIMEVVGAFNKKVGNMIDKQRAEYLAAYEHHMQDIQRELHILRETVAEIAADKTRTEKLESLKKDEQYFKNEALLYDIETNELRKKLHHVTGMMHTAEKERDWFLKKLRSAKKHYNFLKSERAKILKNSDAHSIMSGSTASQDGLYSIGVEIRKSKSSHLPERSTGGGGSNSKVISTNDGLTLQDSLGSLPLEFRQQRDGGGSLIIDQQKLDDHRQNKWATGQLVKIRARKEAMRDFIDQCSKSCEKGGGVWAKTRKRPLQELVTECLGVLDMDDNDYEKTKSMSDLARELAATPAVYSIIATLLTTGDRNPVIQRFEEFTVGETIDITGQPDNVDSLNQPLFDDEPASDDANNILTEDLLSFLRNSNSNSSYNSSVRRQKDKSVNDEDNFMNFE